jgi:ribbon-helix-helix CopG family protein
MALYGIIADERRTNMPDTIGPGRKRTEREPAILVHFYLDRADAAALAEIAWDKRMTKSALIRELVQKLLREDGAP